MIISLIGMSGSGKTTWSFRLAKDKGFRRYSCDELIAEDLIPEFKRLGYGGVSDLSRWIGQPYEERYSKNSQRYLELEAKTLQNILQEIKKVNHYNNVVVDTTGSVVYLPQELLENLKRQTKIVYLETPLSVIEEMIRIYIIDPKPVIWGDFLYKSLTGESNDDTLRRCYAELLKSRSKLYEKLAHIKIDYFTQRGKGFTVDDLLKHVVINVIVHPPTLILPHKGGGDIACVR